MKPVVDVVRSKRLGWYGHVLRKDEEEWVKKVTKMTVEGARPAGRPRKTWQETVDADMRELNILPTFSPTLPLTAGGGGQPHVAPGPTQDPTLKHGV